MIHFNVKYLSFSITITQKSINTASINDYKIVPLSLGSLKKFIKNKKNRRLYI